MLDWLIFNAVIPLSPIVLVWVGSWILVDPTSKLFLIIRDGQMCFYCTTLLALLIRDVSSTQKSSNSIIIGSTVLFFIFSTFIYGVAVSNKDKVIEKKLGWISIFMSVTIIVFVLTIRMREGLL